MEYIMKRMLVSLAIVSTLVTSSVFAMKREDVSTINLIVSDVNPLDPMEHSLEPSQFRTTINVQKDTLLKIPYFASLLETTTDSDEIDLVDSFPIPITKISMQFILDSIQAVYTLEPLIKQFPTFFTQYSPNDIPRTVLLTIEPILKKQHLLQPNVLANILITTSFLDLTWLAHAIGKIWVTQRYTQQQAINAGINKEIYTLHMRPYQVRQYQDQGKNLFELEQSIADMIINMRLPAIHNNILNLVGRRIVSVAGLDLLPADIKTSMLELNLSGNNITSIPERAFANLSNLQRLLLSNNKITYISYNAFAGLNNLQQLYLGGNQLTSIAANTFTGLKSLQYLGLGSNKLTSIAANTFADLNNLQKLELNNNQLTSIAINAFAGLNNLQELELLYNRLNQETKNHVRQALPQVDIMFHEPF